MNRFKQLIYSLARAMIESQETDNSPPMGSADYKRKGAFAIL